jgi:hypothetical protein
MQLSRFRFIGAIVLLATTVACARSSMPVAHEPHAPRLPATSAFGSTLLKTGNSVTFTDGLTIELKEINDSRCPANVQCIWQGQLAVTLAAHGGDLGGQVETIILGTVKEKNRAVGAYDFVLADANVTTATVIVTKPGVVSH